MAAEAAQTAGFLQASQQRIESEGFESEAEFEALQGEYRRAGRRDKLRVVFKAALAP